MMQTFNSFNDLVAGQSPAVLVSDMSVFNAGVLSDNVRAWYIETFPDDAIGEKINNSLTFKELYKILESHGGSGYSSITGVGDSVVRERIFEELADRSDATYDDIYDMWLGKVTTNEQHVTTFNKYPAHISQAILDIDKAMGEADNVRGDALRAAKGFHAKWEDFMEIYHTVRDDPKTSSRAAKQFEDAVDFRQERASKIIRQLQGQQYF